MATVMIFILGMVSTFLVLCVVVSISEFVEHRRSGPPPEEVDPGLDAALHAMRRRRELDEFKWETKIAARNLRNQAIEDMRRLDGRDGRDG